MNRNLIIVVTILVLSAAGAQAQNQMTLLRSGMSFVDILRIKGEPIEKDIHETSRLVLWRYSDGTLRFSNGQLIRSNAQNENSAPKIATRNGNVMSQFDVDEMIRMLPNEAPKQLEQPIDNQFPDPP